MQLLYLSPLPWASFAQRPHKLVEWFHQQTGGQVMWIDPYPTRLPELSDVRRLKRAPSPAVTDVPSWLEVIQPKALPIEPLPLSGWVNRAVWQSTLRSAKRFVGEGATMLGFGKPSILGLQVLSSSKFGGVFYDAMDDFAEFYRGYSKRVMRAREIETIRKADIVLASSTVLHAAWKGMHNDVRLVRNACAPETLPPPLSRATNARPVIGYVGTIGPWFEWDLVLDLARACPHMCIRLVGPVYSPPPEELPSNIEMLPPCKHADAMRFTQGFDIGLIPFRLNRLTNSVDPIKYYEYRALGLPVLTTRFGEMRFRESEQGVYFMERDQDLGSVVREALSERASESIATAMRFIEENSWSARFNAAGLLSSSPQRVTHGAS